jgi:hypothetical protein
VFPEWKVMFRGIENDATGPAHILHHRPFIVIRIAI